MQVVCVRGDSPLPVKLVVVVVGLPPEVGPHQQQEEGTAEDEEPRAFPLREQQEQGTE